MFIKMRESKGFTLVELMIVVAIIGILAAVAVPFYQKYIAKSRLTSKVFPGMHAIETNLGSFYSFQQRFPTVAVTQAEMFRDAATNCFTPTLATNTLVVTIAPDTARCPELASFHNQVLNAKASISAGKIVGWVLSGSVAIQLGLEGER